MGCPLSMVGQQALRLASKKMLEMVHSIERAS